MRRKLTHATHGIGATPRVERSEVTRDRLLAALQAAAKDAIERRLGPEQLVLALKSVETRVGTVRGRSAEASERLHSQILQTMLIAYFGQAEPESPGRSE